LSLHQARNILKSNEIISKPPALLILKRSANSRIANLSILVRQLQFTGNDRKLRLPKSYDVKISVPFFSGRTTGSTGD
jgi:hypothetical protein